MPETTINIFLTLINITTLYGMSWLIGEHKKAMTQHREYLENKDAE